MNHLFTPGGMSLRHSNSISSLQLRISDLPAVLVQEVFSFAFSTDEVASLRAEAFGLHTFNLDPPSPPRDTNSALEIYERLDLSITSIYYPRLQDLPQRETAVVVLHVFEDSVIYDQWTNDGQLRQVRRLIHTFHWLVKRWSTVNTRESIQARYDHFNSVNWDNPYLWGGQHSNRFLRGTKVYINSGAFRGYHAIIVGHSGNFVIFNNSPGLQLLLADQNIIEVPQKNVSLLDYHCYLPFGIPFEPSQVDYNWGSTPNFWGDTLCWSPWVRPIDPVQEEIENPWDTVVDRWE